MDAEQWDARYADKELIWSAEPNQFLPPAVEGMRPGRALDLACGEGRNAIWLARHGWYVLGVDFSSVAIRKAKQLAG
ncbi:MAG: class I SAM-dependent methyltransferase, partial [Acidimicrobiia bacterium]